eukprot:GHVL01010850.1.p1 GENE.GHVL01010850.1~~GHVL01010850.1.p1  ORF type:complete len:1257 (-),score=227.41 GHVL01010850.1:62-3832(-)
MIDNTGIGATSFDAVINYYSTNDESILTQFLKTNASLFVDDTSLDAFLDTIWSCVGLQTKSISPADIKLLNIVKQNLHPLELKLVQKLDADHIDATDDTRSKLQGRISKLKTREFFAYPIYNIFREASDGYARFIQLLLTPLCVSYGLGCKLLLESIRETIGIYQLCPNRCLCLLFDIMQYDNSMCYLLPIISTFPPKNVTQILIFQLCSISERESKGLPPLQETPAEWKNTQIMSFSMNQLICHPLPPEGDHGFYHAAALLAAVEAINFNTLWVYLEPSDTQIKAVGELMIKNDNDELTMLTVTQLLSSDSEPKEKVFTSVNSNKSIWHEIERLKELGRDDVIQLLNVVRAQKLELIAALIELNAWKIVLPLLRYLHRLKFIPSSNSRLRASLATLAITVMDKAIGLEEGMINEEEINIDIDDLEQNEVIKVAKSKKKIETGNIMGCGLIQHENPDDAAKEVFEVLIFLRNHLHLCPNLLTKFINLILIVSDINIIDFACIEIILPSLSLCSPNPSLSNLIWCILKKLPTHHRYSMYKRWRDAYDDTPLSIIGAQCHKVTCQLFKRAVNNAEKNSFGKQLPFQVAKLAANNPLVVFHAVLDNVEKFDNMIYPAIDATNRVSDLACDAFTYVMMEHNNQGLCDESPVSRRQRTYLGEFIGLFYRKHPMCDLFGLMTLIASRLDPVGPSHGVEHILLQKLLHYVGGVQFVEDLNDQQTSAHGGGPILRTEVLSLVRDPEDSVGTRSSQRARKSIREIMVNHPGLLHSLLFNLSKQRLIAMWHYKRRQLKDVGVRYDEAHGTLLHLLEFLSQIAPTCEEYLMLMPPRKRLLCHFDFEVAFMLLRPASPRYHLPDNYINVGDTDMAEPNQMVTWTEEECQAEILEMTMSHLSPKGGGGLSPNFIAIFWRLSLRDIHVPEASYIAALTRVKNTIKDLELKLKDSKTTDRREIRAIEKDLNRQKELRERLAAEVKNQKIHCANVIARLQEELSADDDVMSGNCAKLMESLCQLCLALRVTNSFSDALFCSKFVELLLELKLTWMNWGEYMNHLTNLLPSLIRCCSEREASMLGVFLNESIATAVRWVRDPKAFAKECPHTICYSRITKDVTRGASSVRQMSLEDLHKLWKRCETRLFRSTFYGLAADSDYLEKRNSVTVLDKLIDHFPCQAHIGNVLAGRVAEVEQLCEQSGLQDVALRFKSYSVKLQLRKNNWIKLTEDAPPGGPKSEIDDKKIDTPGLRSGAKRDRSLELLDTELKKRR